VLVIADTSPLNYLVLIEAIELLPRLYPCVLLPHAALDELRNPGAPGPVSRWADSLPSWIELRSGASVSSDERLARLGSGERAAILLAESVKGEEPVLLLVDDDAARREAAARAFRTTGTLGILESAAQQGWIELAVYLLRLRQTNFRVSEKVLLSLIDRDSRK
jgi:predicted nucleic acid-binding protein